MKRKLLAILLSVVCIFSLTCGLPACLDGGFGNQSSTEQGDGNDDKLKQEEEEKKKQEEEEKKKQEEEEKKKQEEEEKKNEAESEVIIGELKYTLNDDGISYSCAGIYSETEIDREKEIKVEIAAACNELPVTAIASYAFSGFNITGISFAVGNRLSSIGEAAFYSCKGLKNITLPESVTEIGRYAFYVCSNLADVNIGANSKLISIGYGAFWGCSSLENITIPKGVSEIGSDAFYDCDNMTAVNITDLDSWYLISFGNYLANPLSNARNLLLNGEPVTEAVFPDGTTSIGHVFCGCSSLTSLTIPESVTTISFMAFEGCAALTSIYIPKSVTSIGEGAFSGCSSVESITVSSENTAYYSADNCLIERENGVLIAGCMNSVIPSDGGVTRIASRAFYGCSSLIGIVIPESITNIDSYAFGKCTNLLSVFFANCEGWSVRHWLGGSTVDISSADLTNPQTAATYLSRS